MSFRTDIEGHFSTSEEEREKPKKSNEFLSVRQKQGQQATPS